MIDNVGGPSDRELCGVIGHPYSRIVDSVVISSRWERGCHRRQPGFGHDGDDGYGVTDSRSPFMNRRYLTYHAQRAIHLPG